MQKLLKNIIKAIDENTYTHKEDLSEVEWKYVDTDIKRDVLRLFGQYCDDKIKEITEEIDRRKSK